MAIQQLGHCMRVLFVHAQARRQRAHATGIDRAGADRRAYEGAGGRCVSRILTFNAGSSTIKLGVFESAASEEVRPLAGGVLDLRVSPLELKFNHDGSRETIELDAAVSDDLGDVIDALLAWLEAKFEGEAFSAAGHRIVHGGLHFDAPVWLDEAIIDRLDELSPLAPLHQPAGLKLVRAMQRARPRLPQVACFDTAFHRTQAPLVTRMAIPRALHEEGVRRYGFHGLSYESIADTLRTALERSQERFPNRARVVFYLGDGEQTANQEPAPFDVGDLVDGGAVLGYGTAEGGPMARTELDGSAGEDVKDANGDVGISVIDEDALGQVADQLGVPYVHRDGGDIGPAMAEADPGQVVEEAGDEVEHHTSVAWACALLAILLLGLDVWLMNRDSARLRKAARS